MHNTFFFYTGRTVGENWEHMQDFVQGANNYAFLFAGVLLLLMTAYVLAKRVIKKRRLQNDETQNLDFCHKDR
jgi:membrane protein DedA with SNARE-associated domain